MNIVGISAFFHDSAACVLIDGQLVAAASEERFSRVKHDARLPVNAYRFCLDRAGLNPSEVDVIAYYEDPAKKRERQEWAAVPGTPERWPNRLAADPDRAIRERLGFDGPLRFFDHHLSHAASAYHYSGFPDAAVLTVDGVGEWATTTIGRADGPTIDIIDEVTFPHSLGLFYATITAYLGFKVNDGEYKVMGLAPYGRPRHAEQMRRMLTRPGPGRFLLDMDYFSFVGGDTMYSERLQDLLGGPARSPGAKLDQFHADVAASAQLVLEEVLLDLVGDLARRVDSPNLCMAGGVALNCVANGRIRREGPFDDIFVQPAAGDAGGCLGAAALAHVEITGDRPSQHRLDRVDLGPAYSGEEVGALLAGTLAEFEDYRGRSGELWEVVAARLAGGEVVGWFQGGMEFGPRALGRRSILADPRDPGVKDRLNRHVKHRESFRPFAPSVLASHAGDHFDIGHASPFMLETCRVTSGLGLDAVTHVDGSARPQLVEPAANPRFAALLEAFFVLTGCPVLLNTSFNMAGEPIVMTPVDALICAARAQLSCLVMEDYLVDVVSLSARLDPLLADWATRPAAAFDREAVDHLYSFT